MKTDMVSRGHSWCALIYPRTVQGRPHSRILLPGPSSLAYPGPPQTQRQAAQEGSAFPSQTTTSGLEIPLRGSRLLLQSPGPPSDLPKEGTSSELTQFLLLHFSLSS